MKSEDLYKGSSLELHGPKTSDSLPGIYRKRGNDSRLLQAGTLPARNTKGNAMFSGYLAHLWPFKPTTASTPASHNPTSEGNHMSTITVKDGTTIYYKDWGKGPVVTFSHGWPLSSDACDGQMLFLAQNGFRVVGLCEAGVLAVVGLNGQ